MNAAECRKRVESWCRINAALSASKPPKWKRRKPETYHTDTAAYHAAARASVVRLPLRIREDLADEPFGRVVDTEERIVSRPFGGVYRFVVWVTKPSTCNPEAFHQLRFLTIR